MSEERDQAVLDALREIRDGQNRIAELLGKHYELAERHFALTSQRVDRSIALQETGLKRVRAVSVVAFPGIVICLVLIGYLVLRYF